MNYVPTVQTVLAKRRRNPRALFSVDEVDVLVAAARALHTMLERAAQAEDPDEWTGEGLALLGSSAAVALRAQS
jgi:uncharacterized membrane protein